MRCIITRGTHFKRTAAFEASQKNPKFWEVELPETEAHMQKSQMVLNLKNQMWDKKDAKIEVQVSFKSHKEAFKKVHEF